MCKKCLIFVVGSEDGKDSLYLPSLLSGGMLAILNNQFVKLKTDYEKIANFHGVTTIADFKLPR